MPVPGITAPQRKDEAGHSLRLASLIKGSKFVQNHEPCKKRKPVQTPIVCSFKVVFMAKKSVSVDKLI
ncbi:Uncharacterized protein DAT39_005218, partial [Clarias magur]